MLTSGLFYAGAGFPLFATPMFNHLGVNWASYLLGFIAAALITIPFLFYIFGEKLRGMSRYNPDKERNERMGNFESRVSRRFVSRQERTTMFEIVQRLGRLEDCWPKLML
jgi:hypothetical protein